MANFADILKKKREADAAAQAFRLTSPDEPQAPKLTRPSPFAPKPQAPVSDEDVLNLRGSGINKKIAEKSNNAYDREAGKSIRDTMAGREAADKFQSEIDADVETLRKQAERQSLKWDASQQAALEGIAQNQYSILIGAAGTGKTTIAKQILEDLAEKGERIDYNASYMVTQELKDDAGNIVGKTRQLKSDFADSKPEMVLSVAICAYTGKATQQIKSAMPEKYHKTCMTIHSLLGYAPVDEWNEYEGKYKQVWRPSFTAEMKLPFQTYVFDEAGMIPVGLWNEFIDACPAGAKIILIGDINQLQPVMGKGVLGYAMSVWPVFELTTIHRQAADNPIIANAHRILAGKLPEAVLGKFDIVSGSLVPGGAVGAGEALFNVIRLLTKNKQFSPITDAIIVPQNVGPIGQLELNDKFITFFNGERRENGVIVNKRMNIHTGTDHKLFAVGDKVMLLQNDNDRNLTNGMVGVIESINLNGRYDSKRAQTDLETVVDMSEVDLDSMNLLDFTDEDAGEGETQSLSLNQRQSSHVTTVKFTTGQDVSFSTAGDYNKLTHAYAATCHKSQGSEYPTVVILCHSANFTMLTREWLYTAVTRARERVVLVCNDLGLQKAIGRQVIRGRTLAEKIKSFQVADKIVFDPEHTETDRNKIPVLYKARKQDV